MMAVTERRESAAARGIVGDGRRFRCAPEVERGRCVPLLSMVLEDGTAVGPSGLLMSVGKAGRRARRVINGMARWVINGEGVAFVH